MYLFLFAVVMVSILQTTLSFISFMQFTVTAICSSRREGFTFYLSFQFLYLLTMFPAHPIFSVLCFRYESL